MKHRGREKTEESIYTKPSPFQEMEHRFCCTEITSKKENHWSLCCNKIEVLVQQLGSCLIVVVSLKLCHHSNKRCCFPVQSLMKTFSLPVDPLQHLGACCCGQQCTVFQRQLTQAPLHQSFSHFIPNYPSSDPALSLSQILIWAQLYHILILAKHKCPNPVQH